jgi:hypothetical protein
MFIYSENNLTAGRRFWSLIVRAFSYYGKEKLLSYIGPRTLKLVGDDWNKWATLRKLNWALGILGSSLP